MNIDPTEHNNRRDVYRRPMWMGGRGTGRDGGRGSGAGARGRAAAVPRPAAGRGAAGCQAARRATTVQYSQDQETGQEILTG